MVFILKQLPNCSSFYKPSKYLPERDAIFHLPNDPFWALWTLCYLLGYLFYVVAVKFKYIYELASLFLHMVSYVSNHIT